MAENLVERLERLEKAFIDVSGLLVDVIRDVGTGAGESEEWSEIVLKDYDGIMKELEEK